LPDVEIQNFYGKEFADIREIIAETSNFED
jgi:hypothetical protein